MKTYIDKPKEQLEAMIERQKKELEIMQRDLERMQQALKDKWNVGIISNKYKEIYGADNYRKDMDELRKELKELNKNPL